MPRSTSRSSRRSRRWPNYCKVHASRSFWTYTLTLTRLLHPADSRAILEHVGVLAQHHLGGAAQTDLLCQGVGVDQLGAHLVTANVHRETVKIGLEQVLRVDPRSGRDRWAFSSALRAWRRGCGSRYISHLPIGCRVGPRGRGQSPSTLPATEPSGRSGSGTASFIRVWPGSARPQSYGRG
jgi:hypothetical protein